MVALDHQLVLVQPQAVHQEHQPQVALAELEVAAALVVQVVI